MYNVEHCIYSCDDMFMGLYEYYFGVCHLLPCTLIHIILYCKRLACSLGQWRFKCHLKSRCYADYKYWHTCFQSINWIEITSVDQTSCFTLVSWISQYTSNLSGPRALTTYFGLSRAQRALPWSNWFTVTLFHCDEEVAHVGTWGKKCIEFISFKAIWRVEYLFPNTNTENI